MTEMAISPVLGKLTQMCAFKQYINKQYIIIKEKYLLLFRKL